MSLSQSERYLHIKTRVSENSEAEEFSFYQAEQLRLEFSSSLNGRRIPMPSAGTCRMEAWIDGTPETLYISKTGTVDESKEKAIIALTPAESNLTTGTYLYTVKVFDSGDTEMGIVAYGSITVLYSPDTDAVSYVGTSPAFSIDLAGTSETDTTKVLKPDGAGGVVWGTDLGGITVQDDVPTTVSSVDTLDFTGAGVTVTDAGSGVATVTIAGGGGGGDVSKVGTPVDNQVGVWTGDGTIEGTAGLTYNGTALAVTGNVTVTGTVDGRDVATDGTKLDGIETAARADRRYLVFSVVSPTDEVATGDGQAYAHIPSDLNLYELVEVHAEVITAGVTGTTDVQIHNVTDAVDMLTTKLTIDSAATGSDTATTPAGIDTLNDDVATNDLLRIDVDAVSTTAPFGLIVTLGFDAP